MRVNTRWVAVLVVVLVAAGSTMVLSGGAGATAPQVQGIDGTTIKVGGIIDAATFAGADDGFKARIARANKNKELGKYQIEYSGSTEDGGNSEKTLSSAQNLVEREQVFAIAPVITAGMQQNVGTYAAGKKVPYFGAGFTNAFCAPNTYGISMLGCAIGGSYSYTTSIDGVASALGKKPSQLKWALVGTAIPDGQHTIDTFKTVVEAAKGKVVYSKAVIPAGGGGDLQPFVSAVMDTKPDVVWVLAGVEVLGFTSAMKAAGYTGTMANSAFYVPNLLKDIPSIATTIDGSIIGAAVPVVEEGLPFAKQMVKDYDAIGVSKITFGGEYAYMTADLMVAALKKVAPNFDKLVPTVAKGWSYQPAKGTFPQTWPAAYSGPSPCTTIVKVSGPVYDVVTPYTCKGTKVKLK